jgi:low temperature requirement protein LtrA
VALVMAPAFTADFSRDNWWIGLIIFGVAVIIVLLWLLYLKKTDDPIDFMPKAEAKQDDVKVYRLPPLLFTLHLLIYITITTTIIIKG